MERPLSKDTKAKQVRVCRGKSCTLFGSARIMERIEKETGLKAGECNDTIDLDYCACLDACEQAPNVGIDNNIIHEAEEDTIMEEIERGGVPIETQEIDIDQLFYKDIIQ